MTSGGLAIRAGDLGADQHLAVETFARCLNPHYDNARFDWVYRQNPHGRGRLWVATDPEDGNVVGIAGAFPRRMRVSGRAELAWVLGDFCVGEAYRAVGPALALQRACLAEVTAGVIPFCYDFPSSGMMAVYRRLGIKPLGRMVRLIRPLSVEARLRELVGSKTVTRHLSALAGVFLAPRDGQRPGVPGREISLHEAPFGDEFTQFCRRQAEQQVVMVERSAEYLNWRYLANPLHRHEVMTARQAGRLAGYAVFRQDREVMTLVDVFAGGDAGMVAELVHHAVVLAWQRGLKATSISLLESSAWIQSLKRAGFRERETSPVVVYASKEAWPEVGDERAWLLLPGDRDS
jgi:GNAT acetyltransferase-like protein